MRALLLPAAIGLTLGALIPHGTLLSASQEVIAFVSLLMAGLLPAMILTATVLRGEAFSAARVRDFGGRLEKQLVFWGALFCASGCCVLLVCAAKMFAAAPAFHSMYGRVKVSIDWGIFAQIACSLASAFLFVMISRLWPAFISLRSLLRLNVTMAEAQALSNDRALADALTAKAERVGRAQTAPQQEEWPT